MVDVIKTLGIKYMPANCASSFRAIHESLINYGGNKMPEYVSCMHEESAVGMAHGYFKASGKPTRINSASGCDSRNARQAGSVTTGPWSPPMQSTATVTRMTDQCSSMTCTRLPAQPGAGAAPRACAYSPLVRMTFLPR